MFGWLNISLYQQRWSSLEASKRETSNRRASDNPTELIVNSGNCVATIISQIRGEWLCTAGTIW